MFLFVFNTVLVLNSINNSKLKYSCNSEEESEEKDSLEEFLLDKFLLNQSVKLFVFNSSNVFRIKVWALGIIEIPEPELRPPIA